MLPYGTRSLQIDLVKDIQLIFSTSTSGSFLFTDFFFDDKKTIKMVSAVTFGERAIHVERN
jgi:hypothetical protein